MPGVIPSGSVQPSQAHHASSKYTVAQLKGAAQKAGFTGTALVVAVAVSLAENGSMDPTTISAKNTNGTRDHGAWQINDGAHPDLMRKYDVHTLQGNADAAYAVYKAAGNSFSPWTTYKSKAYASHLTTAQKSAIDTSGGISGSLADIGNAVVPDFVPGALKQAGDILGHILDPSFWKRVALGMFGIFIAVVAIVLMLESNKTVQSLTKTATKVVPV